MDRTNSDSVIHVAGVGGWVVSRVSTVRLQLVVLCRKKEEVRWNVRSTLIERPLEGFELVEFPLKFVNMGVTLEEVII